MKWYHKAGTWFLLVVLLLCRLPLPASANSPESPPWFTVHLENLPEGTVYAELLICLSETEERYTALNEKNLPMHWQEDAPIVTYRDGDFCSYTFHYADASSFIWTKRNNIVTFFAGAGNSSDTVRYHHADEIAALGDVKLALLDQDGNILQVSQRISLQPREFMTYLSNEFYYDAAADTVEMETYVNGFGRCLYGVLVLLGMMLTCLIEGQVGRLFGLKERYGRLIRWTNVVSQIGMHLSYILFYSLIFWRYTYATIILEILVYVGEYLFYRWRMKDISGKTCFIFTIAANTTSLVLGLLLMTALI